MSEFEDRENELGELTEPLMRERGEDRDYTRDPAEGGPRRRRRTAIGESRPVTGQPRDIQYQQIGKDTPGEIGSQPRIGSVISTFDTRPINATDFIISDYGTITTGAALDISTFSITPQAGRVLVLKQFGYEFWPFYAIQDFGPNSANPYVKVSFYINNIAVNGMSNMRLYQVERKVPFPSHIIISETETLTMTVALTTPPDGSPKYSGFTKACLHTLYGNNLISTGVPKQFEIANKV